MNSVRERKTILRVIHVDSYFTSESMIGDVNLFLNEQDDRCSAEIEIMIAERTARRHGLAMEALCTFLRYGTLLTIEINTILTALFSH